MLNYLFGFNARIGRLAFFFGSFVIGCGYVMLVYGVTGNALASGRTDVLLAQAASNTPLVIGFYATLAISFMLQSMRVRDIGWDPVCVMIGWVGLVVLDRVIASRFPEYALTYQHTNTVAGALVNGALMLALLFWPAPRSEEAQSSPYDSGSESSGVWRNSSAPTASTNRIARVASGEFGGRTR
ncbi:DUF805 domain-containing protein [Bradyrhizobium genosp. L]|uniref:DUF805 domain-containing protein n=1 Tax=Bradyrhizobium genosp. L TaxID=83637 RepID=UPI0018A29D07|nr:DUF805 domain-containing protein [Bradyrhizobium genosp. L]QPF84299.1 DUF805 domain-containing protein [Bradyrhizobium genosp. L]